MVRTKNSAHLYKLKRHSFCLTLMSFFRFHYDYMIECYLLNKNLRNKSFNVWMNAGTKSNRYCQLHEITPHPSTCSKLNSYLTMKFCTIYILNNLPQWIYFYCNCETLTQPSKTKLYSIELTLFRLFILFILDNGKSLHGYSPKQTITSRYINSMTLHLEPNFHV